MDEYNYNFTFAILFPFDKRCFLSRLGVQKKRYQLSRTQKTSFGFECSAVYLEVILASNNDVSISIVSQLSKI